MGDKNEPKSQFFVEFLDFRCENIKFQEPEMVPVDVGKKYGNCFLQDVVMRKMEKVFSKVPKGERPRRGNGANSEPFGA